MPLSFVRPPDATPRYAIFGKLPRRADFIRVNATDPVIQEFDDLLGRSLTLAGRQATWSESRYLSTGCSDFHYTSNDGRWSFFGVLRPSSDTAGRLYPVVAGTMLPSACVAPHTPELSIANELFFSGLRHQLADAVADSIEMLACRRFLEAQLSHNPHGDADIQLAAQVLDLHLERTQATRLEQDLDEGGRGCLDAHLLAFAFHAQLLHRYGASIPRQAIMLPLPQGAGEEALGQATWLTLYRASVKRPGRRQPDYISIVRDGRRHLVVAPERFSERSLAVLWGAEPEPGSMLDPTSEDAPWVRHQAYAEASYIIARQRQDPAFTLKALIMMMEKFAKSLA